jgi:hypothetical protein
MANILISFYQPIIENDIEKLYCFYDSLSLELENYGNNVLMLNTKPYGAIFRGLFDLTNDDLLVSIVKFSPDLIIAINNQICNSILKATSCPVLVNDADGIDFFANKELFSNYKDRYFFLTYYETWSKNELESLNIDNNKIINIHMATSVKPEKKEKEHNISFIGSKMIGGGCFKTKYNSPEAYKVLQEYWKDNTCDYEAVMEKYYDKQNFSALEIFQLFDSRNYILSSVYDLGLSLYGAGWEQPSDIMGLSLAFCDTPVFSLKHNQDLYNSSKICLSISHAQTRGYAFPWRCYDIMASNGLLISSYSRLLEEKTSGFLSIPMYHSPFDVRGLCKKYLAEPNLREDIISLSNEFIDKYGRWKDNFEHIESFLNVQLTNKTCTSKHQKPEVLIIPRTQDVIAEEAKTPKKPSLFQRMQTRLKNASKYKLISLLFVCLIIILEIITISLILLY